MLILVRWLSRWPIGLLHRVGGWLGHLAWRLDARYRRRFELHAGCAGLDAATRRAAQAEAGRLVAELPWLWLGAEARPILRHCRWEGDTLIDDAVAAGRGLVLLTPHLGSFEVCAQAYAERWGGSSPITVLYRPARQPWLRELEEVARARPGLLTVPTSLAGVRQMLRSLRRGGTVGLLPDQVPPDGLGVWAPFFGRPAYTMTLAARLVQQTGAAWLLMWAERLPDGAGWRVHVSAPQAALPPLAGAGADEQATQVAAATVINAEMERMVMQKPSQYLWGYARYKSPRPGAQGAGAAP